MFYKETVYRTHNQHMVSPAPPREDACRTTEQTALTLPTAYPCQGSATACTTIPSRYGIFLTTRALWREQQQRESGKHPTTFIAWFAVCLVLVWVRKAGSCTRWANALPDVSSHQPFLPFLSAPLSVPRLHSFDLYSKGNCR